MSDEDLDIWLRAWMRQGGWNARWFGLFRTFAHDLRQALLGAVLP